MTGLPVQEDLLAATWPSDPLTADEVAQCAALGVWVPTEADVRRWPVFAALTRQALAAASLR